MKNEKLTVERLKESFGDSVHKAIEFAKDFYPSHPQLPAKPRLGLKVTSRDAVKFASDLVKWEKDESKHKENMNAYHKAKNEIDEVIKAYIKDISGFNNIPEQYKEKVWNKAWEDGHSYGYADVFGCLVNLVDIFA